MIEEDGDLNLIGWVTTSAGGADQGLREKRMIAYDGGYVVRTSPL